MTYDVVVKTQRSISSIRRTKDYIKNVIKIEEERFEETIDLVWVY